MAFLWLSAVSYWQSASGLVEIYNMAVRKTTKLIPINAPI